MERRTTSPVAWTEPRLDGRRKRILADLLDSLIQSGAGRWGWLLERNGARVELLASSGMVKPHRTNWVGKLPRVSGQVTPDKVSDLSPFHKSVRFGQLKFYSMSTGGLVLEGTLEPPQRLLEELQIHCELLASQKETASLRKKVQRLSAELKDTREVSARLRPALEQGERRAEALSLWYRQATEMLTSTQLRSRLPRLARQAQQLLEVDVSLIFVREIDRVRVWGGEELGEELSGAIVLDQLGTLGRKVLEAGEVYRYQRTGKRSDRFLDGLGLPSVLVLPLELDGRILGGVLFGHRTLHRFSADEIDLARLTAYQSALFLENTLLVTGSDVERVVARAVLDSMADGVFTLDWEKKITSFNPAAEQITGWPMEDAIGRSCHEVMQSRYPCGQDGAESGGCDQSCPLLRLLADQDLMERGLTVEGTIENRYGETRHVSSTYSVVADRGDLLGAVVLFRDVTQRRELEQMKSDYAAALSHDLKTPLTAMKGYAVTLLRHGHKLDEDARKEALEVINFEIDRVSRMFDNLLHQARLEAGVKSQILTEVNPAKVIKQVVSLYAYSGRSHKLLSDVESEELMLVTDRDQLDQVLNNLVSNALKYTPGGSQVVVRCQKEGDHMLFEVEDNGPGISAMELPLVFNRYHRVPGLSSQRARGTGLGLHITRMLVESLGGETGVRSEVGQGSCFWFRLPVYPNVDGENERENLA